MSPSNDQSTMHRRGFTLVELLVVIGIIVLLISILMPALNRARQAAVQTQCLSVHRQLMLAMNMYINQNKGWAPNQTRKADAPNAVHSTLWFHKDFLGQFLGNRATYDQQKNTTDSIYCPAVSRISTASNLTLGIGYNIRFGSQIALWDGTYPLVKFTSIRRPSNVLIFVDSGGDNRWEKFYYNEGNPANSTGANSNGMVTYRHGRNTVVSFADSHAEAFGVADPNGTGFNDGLHAAFLSKRVTFKAVN